MAAKAGWMTFWYVSIAGRRCFVSSLDISACPQTYLRDSNFDTVGLIEMSGWIDDINFMNKMSYYSGSLSRRAGQAGYPYAAMLTAPSGYHMGT